MDINGYKWVVYGLYQNHPAMFFFRIALLTSSGDPSRCAVVALVAPASLLVRSAVTSWRQLQPVTHCAPFVENPRRPGRRNPKESEGLMGVETCGNQKHLRKRWWKTSLFSSKSMRCQEWKEKLIMCIWLQIQFQSSLHECCENQASMCWVLTHVAIMLLGKICVLLVSPFSHLKQER